MLSDAGGYAMGPGNHHNGVHIASPEIVAALDDLYDSTRALADLLDAWDPARWADAPAGLPDRLLDLVAARQQAVDRLARILLASVRTLPRSIQEDVTARVLSIQDLERNMLIRLAHLRNQTGLELQALPHQHSSVRGYIRTDPARFSPQFSRKG